MPAFRLVFLDPGYLSDVSKKQFNGAEWWMGFLGGESSFMENKAKKKKTLHRWDGSPSLASPSFMLSSSVPFFIPSISLSFMGDYVAVWSAERRMTVILQI